jgi:putative ABC transport system substrate-binding protein
MKRREFIAFAGGAVVAWSVGTRAQQSERMRRIGVLMGIAEDHPEAKARLAGFQRGLEKRGWFEGRNVRIDYRFAPGGTQAQVMARELIALQPDVILANSTRLLLPCSGRPARFRSCSLAWPTRSARDSLRAWRSRAAI